MEKGRTLNDEDLPRLIMVKKYRMLLTYYLRDFWKRIFITWPVILFAVSLVLYLLILIPNTVLHRFPILGEWPRVLELDGNVLMEINEANHDKCLGVAGATVEVGGYNSITNRDGKFHIEFVSKSSTNIPVIIQYSNKTLIKRVSFEGNQFEKKVVFVLNGE